MIFILITCEKFIKPFGTISNHVSHIEPLVYKTLIEGWSFLIILWPKSSEILNILEVNES